MSENTENTVSVKIFVTTRDAMKRIINRQWDTSGEEPTYAILVRDAWAAYQRENGGKGDKELTSTGSGIPTSVIETTQKPDSDKLNLAGYVETHSVEVLLEILRSGDEEIIDAIRRNLSAFVRLVRVERAEREADLAAGKPQPDSQPPQSRGATGTDRSDGTDAKVDPRPRIVPARKGGAK